MSDIEVVEIDCTSADSNEQIPDPALPDVPSPNFHYVKEDPAENSNLPGIKCNLDISEIDKGNDSATSTTTEINYRLSTVQDDDIQNLIVKCSACGREVNHHDEESIKKHRHLGVLICKECYDFYSEGEFSEDDTGYNYCRWCAQGGQLYGCDFCPNAFCFKCVQRNFGRGEAHRIWNQKWKCYLCEPNVLQEKVQFCDMIIKYAQKLDQKKRKFSIHGLSNETTTDSEDNSAIPSKWLPLHLNRVIFLCSNLQQRMHELGHKHGKNKQSTKEVVAEFNELIDVFYSEIREAQKVVQVKYNHYVQHKKPTVEKEKSAVGSGSFSVEVINISDDEVKPKENSDGVILNGVMEDVISEQVLGCKVSEDITGDSLNVLNACKHGLTNAEKTVNTHVGKESTTWKGSSVSDAETEPNLSHDDDS